MLQRRVAEFTSSAALNPKPYILNDELQNSLRALHDGRNLRMQPYPRHARIFEFAGWYGHRPISRLHVSHALARSDDVAVGASPAIRGSATSLPNSLNNSLSGRTTSNSSTDRNGQPHPLAAAADFRVGGGGESRLSAAGGGGMRVSGEWDRESRSGAHVQAGREGGNVLRASLGSSTSSAAAASYADHGGSSRSEGTGGVGTVPGLRSSLNSYRCVYGGRAIACESWCLRLR